MLLSVGIRLPASPKMLPLKPACRCRCLILSMTAIPFGSIPGLEPTLRAFNNYRKYQAKWNALLVPMTGDGALRRAERFPNYAYPCRERMSIFLRRLLPREEPRGM